MSEAAPQAASGQADERERAALRWYWGGAYLIGCDDERGWWAARRDQVGGYRTAPDPDGLRAAIREDGDLKPVPRDCADGGEP
jgi:hypothetical protein